MTKEKLIGKACAKLIKLWLEESKENTVVRLSQRSGLSESWLRALATGEKNTTVYTLYRIAMEVRNSAGFVKEVLMENSEHSADVLTELEELGLVFTDLEIYDAREALFVARVVALEFVSKLESELLLGGPQSAEFILEKFELYNLIVRDSEGNSRLNTRFQELKSAQSLKVLAKLIIDCHNALAGHRGESRVFGLNDEGIDEVNKLISGFQVSLAKILKNPRYHGRKVFGVTLYSALI